MPTRYLLYLDASAMHCFHWKQGRTRLMERFPTTEAGIGGFARFVQRHRTGLFSLMVDVMEEGFQHEVLPYVRGGDRDAMLKRKGSQAFFGTPLSTAVSLGRERGGRRDERFLFVALTRQALVEPWLQALRAAHAALTGVHSPPLVLDRLMQRLASDRPRCLLVCFTPGGMRQTFFESGRLRFSRLAQSLDDIPIGLEAQCAAEILKTHSYLVGQRLIPRNAPLTVHVLVNDADFKRLRPALADTDELRFEHLPIDVLARKLNLAETPRGSNALPILLGSMMRESGATQLADPGETRYYGIWKMRQAVVGTGLALFAAAMLFAGKVWFDGQSMAQERAGLAARTAAQQRQLAALQQALPPLPVSVDALRPAVETLESLRHEDASPARWLIHLSHALDLHRDVRLEQVDWRYRDAPPDTRVAPGAAGRARLSLPASLASDRRALIETAQAFVEDLSPGTDGSARMTRMPVQLQSDQALRGSSSDEVDTTRPEFEVEFALGARP
ncbi:hypothetical protein G3580_14885 [Nitrogeniibacter mangrovi]|uniref:Uncharacterized protein n=1 Tax=Nitrogeniibacter mangrovi TaxID=2016596 RepID=A0A6C1B530_9RHOO|nr:hypothetical protein [Nitrogeniibacter mangrovi]QID18792.1 hypothetical protein G3580_14885 [Nitrogeniibacter mangrovi]